MKIRLPDKEMDRAFRTRDSAYDGLFYVGVRTTGIFCRPTCPARKPKPENVEFLTSIQEALLAGYRACKRCRPTQTNGEHPSWVLQLLEKIDTTPTERIKDWHLRTMSIDPTRARRYFKRNFGMTFQAYHRAKRLGLSLSTLHHGAALTATAYDHGYESNSGFRDAFEKLFGQPPGRGRNADVMLVHWMQTPLGPMIAGATDKGVCLLEFTDRRSLEHQLATLGNRLQASAVPGMNHHLHQLREELSTYFAGTLREFTFPTVIPGTPFQQSVWKELLRIPYGETICYETLAQAVDRPGAVRAVGTANGANRIAIVIPCHRVVRKDGTLGGYGGGLRRKEFLLSLECDSLAKQEQETSVFKDTDLSQQR